MIDKGFLEQKIVSVLETVYDPEIPVNIYELGLVYDIKINDNSDVDITMTLTSPACPVAESLPGEVRQKVKSIEDVNEVNINLVWEPPWNKDMMSEEAKLNLGFL
ncbi:MAG: SUF system Fe-S cluster assembly protein [Ignavibacteriales bacterium]|nr:SUF system Fe-S cluster assembly protein [Ignavibacteriota bacterium]MCB0749236.1 SUF system Fe-S cluster assembly protein [Ignavibacteriota bacterium]MCB9248158.1 SUF system Fe-S cluster assembly protein [Ignavibacteriales bacterium]